MSVIKNEETITPERIEEFLAFLEEKGRGDSSLQSYRRILTELCRYLPEEKVIGEGTGQEWKSHLEKMGFQPATVNTHMSVWNSFLRFLGRREWQLEDFNREKENVQPQLSRAEYLRLLSAAKHLGKEKSYLLIKTLGGAGMRIQELPQLTVEAVKLGVVELEYHNSRQKRMLHLPEGLKEELLDFAKREGRSHGPVFSSSEGMPMARSSVNYFINIVCHDARVAEEKANPRCLWKMYQETCRGIRANIAVLIEQSYQKILEDEQLAMGWKEK
jgi:Site-specific recombinase XerD